MIPYAVNLIVSARENYMFLIYEAAAVTCSPLTHSDIPAAGFHSQACSCSWSLGLACMFCPAALRLMLRSIWRRLERLSASVSETGRPGQLFTHLICLRDKASFDTDSRQLAHTDTHTSTARVTNARLQQCAHTHGNTHGRAGSR